MGVVADPGRGFPSHVVSRFLMLRHRQIVYMEVEESLGSDTLPERGGGLCLRHLLT